MKTVAAFPLDAIMGFPSYSVLGVPWDAISDPLFDEL